MSNSRNDSIARAEFRRRRCAELDYQINEAVMHRCVVLAEMRECTVEQRALYSSLFEEGAELGTRIQLLRADRARLMAE